VCGTLSGVFYYFTRYVILKSWHFVYPNHYIIYSLNDIVYFQCCYGIIDLLLDSTELLGPLVNCVDVSAAASDPSTIQVDVTNVFRT